MANSSRSETIDAIHNRLFFRLFQVGNTLARQAKSELGITTVQWAVLGALSRSHVNSMSFSELAEYLVVSRQNLDGVLKRLERDSHVRRVANSSDRRAKDVILTEAGRKYWQRLQPNIFEFYRQAVQDFRFDDKVSLVHFLNTLNRAMGDIDLSRAKSASAQKSSKPRTSSRQRRVEALSD